MKRYIAILLIFFTYQAQASNLCYHQPTTCKGVFNCDSGCEADFAQIVAQFSTMQEVWQVTQTRKQGPWTVIQTPGANWYTNAGIAATCTCPNYGGVTIFVQQ